MISAHTETPDLLDRPRWVAELQRPAVAGCVLLALALLSYLPALSAGFVFDDAMYVLQDTRVTDPAGLGRIWSEISGPEYSHQYYPMTSSAWWLQWRLWGANPVGYHVVNVLLHGLCALLLWRVLSAVKAPGAWLAGALFAVHPMLVTSVAWVSELKNVLSCVLMLGSLRAFLGGARWGWLGWALFAGALLSKTATASMPVALGLLLYYRDGRVTARHATRLVLLAVVGLGAVTMTAYLEWLHRAGGEVFALGLGERIRVASAALWFYAWKLICPWDLMFVYPRWDPTSWGWLTWWWPVSVAGGIAGLWLWRDRIGRGPFAAVLYFIVAVAPVSLANVAYTRHSYVADHWVYWGSLGLIALIAGIVVTAWRSAIGIRLPSLRRTGLGAAASVAALAVLGGMTWSRAGIFATSQSLWGDTVHRNPESSLAHYNLGVALWARGRLDEAQSHYAEAARLDPRSTVARNNLAIAHRAHGDLDEALRWYREALAIDSALADVHLNTGSVLLQMSRNDEATLHFCEALRIQPDLAMAHFGLASTLRKQGRLTAARRRLEESLRLDPAAAVTHHSLGKVARDEGCLDEAAEHFATAARLDPGFAAARFNLGHALRDLGHPGAALPHVLGAVALAPQEREYRQALADLLIALGNGGEAWSENRRITETPWVSNR